MTKSINGVPIRLSDERWLHIADEHCELSELRQEILQTIESPDKVLAGSKGELLAIRETESGKWLVAVYRELGEDGFVITAFMTRRIQSLSRRRQVWP